MPSRSALFLRMCPALAGMAMLRPESRQTAASQLEKLARRRPDHPLVLFQDRRVSYGEMNECANRVAHWGSAMGWRRGETVALLMENRPEYLATWLGLAKLGVSTALINTNLTGRALAHVLEAAETRTLILGTECLDRFAGAASELRNHVEVWIERDPEAVDPDRLPPGASDLNSALAGQPGTNPT